MQIPSKSEHIYPFQVAASLPIMMFPKDGMTMIRWNNKDKGTVRVSNKVIAIGVLRSCVFIEEQ
jgi:hypothetical protein